jgi:hypothetical protein
MRQIQRVWTAAGALAVALFLMLGAAPAAAMRFSIEELPVSQCPSGACPAVIVASGEIGLDSDTDFIGFIGREVTGRRVSSTILMSSPGGNLLGSLKLGIAVRQLGFSIMVGQISDGALKTARCYSACAYTLAGGRTRIVPSGSEVGVHRAWVKDFEQRDIAGTGLINPKTHATGVTPVIQRYLSTMGVSSQLVALADGTPSSEIRVLTPAELTRFRLATRERGARRQRN